MKQPALPPVARRLNRWFLLLLLLSALNPNRASAWGGDGHAITAQIAAQHLSDAARAKVFALLQNDAVAGPLLQGRDPHDVAAISAAMAAVASWPDVIKRQAFGAGTSSWHFIDLAASDTAANVPARCGGEDCLTARIISLSQALRQNQTVTKGQNHYGGTEQVKFLIHFYGDLHQPLHDATDADGGGNCLKTSGYGQSELHAVLDTGLVKELMKDNHGHPLTILETANDLNQAYGSNFAAWTQTIDPITQAIESHTVAFTSVYGPIFASGDFFDTQPRPFLHVSVPSCIEADAKFRTMQPLEITTILDKDAIQMVGEQLAKGGFRLATALNSIFGGH